MSRSQERLNRPVSKLTTASVALRRLASADFWPAWWPARRWTKAVLLTAMVLQLGGCTTYPPTTGMSLPDSPLSPEAVAEAEAAKHGIRVTGLHLSAHGYVLDLRYRVLDKELAAPLLDKKKKVYLLDEAHNAKLGVPESPVIGGMRQTSRNYTIYTDRDYFILFVNPGRAVRPGDVLKLAVDSTTIAALKVR
jgi:hypothetical protein